jgi:hypothetical protein
MEIRLLEVQAFEWCIEISEGMNEVEFDDRLGRLIISKYSENVGNVRTLVQNDGNLTRIIVEEVHVSRDLITFEDILKRFSATTVPTKTATEMGILL